MQRLYLCLLLLLCTGNAFPQIMEQAPGTLRLYEDDDFFNVWGKGTDEAYSNGTNISYFYVKQKPSTCIDKWIFPRAGKKALNVFEWSIMQVMVTPQDISDTAFQKHDYFYAGALFATHGLTSCNPVKRYSLHSELVFGILGPWSLAKETQSIFHQLIHYQQPMGWTYQVPNSPLLNYNLSYERMLWNPVKLLEVTGGATLRAGTMYDGISAISTIRFGLFNPYFGRTDGSRALRKIQVYTIARPQAHLIFYNALLEGGILQSGNPAFMDVYGNQTVNMRHRTIQLDYGVGTSINRFTITYTQKTLSEWMAGTRHHSVGNISIYIPLRD